MPLDAPDPDKVEAVVMLANGEGPSGPLLTMSPFDLIGRKRDGEEKSIAAARLRLQRIEEALREP